MSKQPIRPMRADAARPHAAGRPFAARTCRVLALAAGILAAGAGVAGATHAGAAQRPPVASFSATPSAPTTTDVVRFIDQSTDADGDLMTWYWTFGDGATGSARYPEHTFAKAGSYLVTLRVQDTAGHAATTSLSVYVSQAKAPLEANVPPAARFLLGTVLPAAGEAVRFTDASADTDGWIVAWAWDFGDGTRATLENPTHAYAQPGDYLVMLTVTDDRGGTGRVAETVSIRPPLLPMPYGPPGTVAAGLLQRLVDAAAPGATVRFPAGTYHERVSITKDLTVLGDGDVVLDGGAEPAIVLSAGQVNLRGLTARSSTVAIAMHDARSVGLWDVRADAPTPYRSERVAFVYAVTAPDREQPLPPAADGTVTHGHPVQIRVVHGDGSPWGGAHVRVVADGQPLFDGTADAAGYLPATPVSHRADTPSGPRDIESVALVDGTETRYPLDSHGGAVVIRASTTAARPPNPLAPLSDPAVAAAATATAAAGLGVAAMLRWWEPFRWRWLLALAPFYSRFARSEILEHGLRESIYGYVEANPGAHLRGIKRDLDLKHGTLLHHLGMLEAHGFVKSARDGMYRRYFVTNTVPRFAGAEASADQVFEFVRAHPGTTNADVAAALGKRPSLVHYHVQRLITDGRVRKSRDGREVRIFASLHVDLGGPPRLRRVAS